MNDNVRSAAQTAENNPVFRRIARGGYVANGLMHALIGAAALSIAFTGEGQSDQSTALESIQSAPLGAVALWTVAGLLLALGLFHLVVGTAKSFTSKKRKWGQRISHWGQGIAYLVLGGIAISVAMGSSSNGDDNAEEASRGLLDMPGGPILLALVGAGVAIAGIVFICLGIGRGFKKKMRIPAGGFGRLITVLGSVGNISKGASILVIGGLIALAAIRNDPESAGALNAAIQTVYEWPGGPVIVGAIGVGFFAYAAFLVFRARYAKFS